MDGMFASDPLGNGFIKGSNHSEQLQLTHLIDQLMALHSAPEREQITNIREQLDKMTDEMAELKAKLQRIASTSTIQPNSEQNHQLHAVHIGKIHVTEFLTHIIN